MFSVSSCLNLSGGGPIFFWRRQQTESYFPYDDLMWLRELRAICPCVPEENRARLCMIKYVLYALYISQEMVWCSWRSKVQLANITIWPSNILGLWNPYKAKLESLKHVSNKHLKSDISFKQQVAHLIADQMYSYYYYYYWYKFNSECLVLICIFTIACILWLQNLLERGSGICCASVSVSN